MRGICVFSILQNIFVFFLFLRSLKPQHSFGCLAPHSSSLLGVDHPTAPGLGCAVDPCHPARRRSPGRGVWASCPSVSGSIRMDQILSTSGSIRGRWNTWVCRRAVRAPRSRGKSQSTFREGWPSFGRRPVGVSMFVPAQAHVSFAKQPLFSISGTCSIAQDWRY